MDAEVILQAEGKAGRIRLNRPKAIHALNTGMCAAMLGALTAWREDPAVEIVLIDHAEGRGFCAGGDIRMIATSGAALADEATIAGFAELMAIATVVTPNIPELAVLTGREALSEDDIVEAGLELAARHDVMVLAKGGHAETGDQVLDRVLAPSGKIASFGHARLDTRHTHGTGCTLSAALATMLAHRLPLTDAVRMARAFTFAAIENAPGFGAGHGPLGHQAVRRLAEPD